MLSPQEMKEKQLLFLTKLFKLANGNNRKFVLREEVINAVGL
jgi:hypothetical protein